jgi:hypothetical protein
MKVISVKEVKEFIIFMQEEYPWPEYDVLEAIGIRSTYNVAHLRKQEFFSVKVSKRIIKGCLSYNYEFK